MLSQPIWLQTVKDGMWGMSDKWGLRNTYTTLTVKTEGKGPHMRFRNGRITLESFL
jgi:hypothetical protein